MARTGHRSFLFFLASFYNNLLKLRHHSLIVRCTLLCTNMEKKWKTCNQSVIQPLKDSPPGSLGGPHRLHCPNISFIYSKLSGIFSCILLHGLAYNRNSFALISVTKCNKASQTCRIFRFRSSKALGYSFQEKEELQSFPQQRTFASLASNSWPAAVFLHVRSPLLSRLLETAITLNVHLSNTAHKLNQQDHNVNSSNPVCMTLGTSPCLLPGWWQFCIVS